MPFNSSVGLPSKWECAGPLEVSCGDAAHGLLGWVGASGGSWAAWRFPRRRRVAALLLAAPPALFRGCSFELSRQDARVGGFVAVPLRLEAWGADGGADGAPDGCLLIVPTVRRMSAWQAVCHPCLILWIKPKHCLSAPRGVLRQVLPTWSAERRMQAGGA